jgi:hypothetical protein
MIVDKNGRVMRLMLASIALASACEVAAQAELKVLSSRPDAVSGGDAVIEVRVPQGVSALDVTILGNGADVSSSFVATDVTTLQGLVSGLSVGLNVILAKTRSTAASWGKRLWRIFLSSAPSFQVRISGRGFAKPKRQDLARPRRLALAKSRRDMTGSTRTRQDPSCR